MTKTATAQTPADTSSAHYPMELPSVEDCSSILVCLDTRRFVVVQCDDPKDLWPIDGGWEKLRRLQPGDEVIYKGDRTRVRALDVYR